MPRLTTTVVIFAVLATTTIANAEVLPAASERAEGQISVSGNGVDLTSGQTTISASDNTDFGVVFTGDGHTHQRSYYISNPGDADLTDVSITISGAGAAAFSIWRGFPPSLPAGKQGVLDIRFSSTTEGLHEATVTISATGSDSDFSFAISGIADDGLSAWDHCETCGSRDGLSYAPSDAAVCSGHGDCLGESICECENLVTGRACWPAVRWSNGRISSEGTFDFSPRLVLGPELSDPEAVYSLVVEVEYLDIFPGSQGITFGVVSVNPPNYSHDIGTNDEEWGWLSKNGNKVHDSKQATYGPEYGLGDRIALKYDARVKTLQFAHKGDGETDWQVQDVAYYDVEAPEGKDLFVGLSVTCFGRCKFTLVEEDVPW